jgi:hypothetical protein
MSDLPVSPMESIYEDTLPGIGPRTHAALPEPTDSDTLPRFPLQSDTDPAALRQVSSTGRLSSTALRRTSSSEEVLEPERAEDDLDFDRPAPDRRGDARHQLMADVLIMAIDRGVEPFWATTEDLGQGGLLIHSSRLLVEGASLILEVHPYLGERFRARAVVVHRVEGVGIGCRFTHMTSRARRELLRLLEGR